MLKIYNGTPHEIHFIVPAYTTFKPEMRKIVINDENHYRPSMSIPSHGMLNLTIEKQEAKRVKTTEGMAHIINKNVTNVDPLPDGYDIYIVSGLYASFAPDNPKLYTVIDPVYSKDGKTVLGCIGIGRVI